VFFYACKIYYCVLVPRTITWVSVFVCYFFLFLMQHIALVTLIINDLNNFARRLLGNVALKTGNKLLKRLDQVFQETELIMVHIGH
jgi:hypothetical protein